MMIGRSMKEYNEAAQRKGLIDLSNVQVASYRNEVEQAFKDLSKNPTDYLVMCTGNQGEPNAVLSRVVRDEYPFTFDDRDHVVFSCSTIPTPVNKANRYNLENKLKNHGTRFYKDVHASGHGMREDVRDLIKMFQPQNIVPAHGDTVKLSSCAELAMEEGYALEETVHVSQNGRVLDL